MLLSSSVFNVDRRGQNNENKQGQDRIVKEIVGKLEQLPVTFAPALH